MTKKFFAFFMAFTVLLSSSFITVYASDSGDGYFSDYDDTKFNPANNTIVTIKHILQGAQDYHNGNISASDFVDNYLVSVKDGTDANLTGLINSAVDSYNTAGTITRDCLNGLINGINGVITGNGGNVSGFPVGGNIIARYNIPGGGYIDFFPVERGYPQEGIYDLGYNVYSTDGSLALSNAVSCYCDPKGHMPCFFINSFNYSYSDPDSSFYSVSFDCYDPYPTKKSSNGIVRIPFVAIAGDPDRVTDTPDVGVLSDDDFYRYINSLINNLDNTYPDTSTLEGKLQEILNKMDKLGNGCNCAELAEAVYALLDFLQQNGGGGTDNTDLVNALYELNNTLKHNGNNNVDLSDINTKLDKIYNELAGIHNDIKNDDDAVKMKNAGTESILKFSEKLQNKFQVGAIKTTIDNFSSAVFDKRVFSQDDKSGRIMVASVYADGSCSSYSYFSLPVDFNFFGQSVQVDLAEFCKFIPPGLMSTVKDFISYILWFAFLIGLYRSLPGLLAGVGRVETHNSKLNGG